MFFCSLRKKDYFFCVHLMRFRHFSGLSFGFWAVWEDPFVWRRGFCIKGTILVVLCEEILFFRWEWDSRGVLRSVYVGAGNFLPLFLIMCLFVFLNFGYWDLVVLIFPSYCYLGSFSLSPNIGLFSCPVKEYELSRFGVKFRMNNKRLVFWIMRSHLCVYVQSIACSPEG